MADLASDDVPGDQPRGSFERRERICAGHVLEDEQVLAEGDQTLADGDQTASDTDQTSADRDQLAADRDQAASDRDLVAGGSLLTHQASRDARERSSDQREHSALVRDHSAGTRLDAGERRDAIADDRDVAATARDEAADARDRVMAQHDAAAQHDDDEHRSRSERLVRAAGAHKRAVARRAQAAQYRALAARDRELAAQDREQAARERRRALVDREALTLALQREQRRRDEALRREQDAGGPAGTLRRGPSSALPPRIAGVDVAVHYEAVATEPVGGEFYDVFPLTAGRSGFFVGDVCVKGPQAAAVASLARYAMRGAAMLDDEPATVLRDLDAALRREPGNDARMCTGVYGEIDVRSHAAAIRLVVAGHLVPLIVRADGAVEPATARGDRMGAVADRAFDTCEVALAVGDAIIIHTDAILDATIDRIDVDEQRVADLLRGAPHASAQGLVDRLVHAVRRVDRPLREDVAIIALRRTVE